MANVLRRETVDHFGQVREHARETDPRRLHHVDWEPKGFISIFLVFKICLELLQSKLQIFSNVESRKHT